ncbi:MAG TPA: NUDIX hydrolase [Gillisia sp.]|nr:NUDIX hydrolase [Gillisia sp.]
MRDQPIFVTVDSVIFYAEENNIYVLLIQRKNDPFKSQWALPGGFLEVEETLETGAARELEEETGIKVSSLKQIGVFGKPGRDPRGRVLSIAFAGKLSLKENLMAGDDAGDASWFNIKELPPLAFDHKDIIEAAKQIL